MSEQERIVTRPHRQRNARVPGAEARLPRDSCDATVGAAVRIGHDDERLSGRALQLVASLRERGRECVIAERWKWVVPPRVQADRHASGRERMHLVG